jgi:hypothetical protein
MSESPIAQLLAAFDTLDVEAVAALFASDARILTADGRRGEGLDGVRALIADVSASLSSTAHRITAEWHQGNVWIAEVEADYDVRDWLELKALPRAFVLRDGREGIVELHVYGAHEHPLTEYPTGEQGMRVGGQWMPPL